MTFAVYLGRWQLSTPILWLVIAALGVGLWQTVAANLVGGAVFFWFDRWLFRGGAHVARAIAGTDA